MHNVVLEQVQKQLEEALQLKAQLNTQRQEWKSVEASLQAKAAARTDVTLGELTDACKLQSWVLYIIIVVAHASVSCGGSTGWIEKAEAGHTQPG